MCLVAVELTRTWLAATTGRGFSHGCFVCVQLVLAMNLLIALACLSECNQPFCYPLVLLGTDGLPNKGLYVSVSAAATGTRLMCHSSRRA